MSRFLKLYRIQEKKLSFTTSDNSLGEICQSFTSKITRVIMFFSQTTLQDSISPIIHYKKYLFTKFYFLITYSITESFFTFLLFF